MKQILPGNRRPAIVRVLIPLIVLTAVLISCRQTPVRKTTASPFPYPQVPLSMAGSPERAASWIAPRFWLPCMDSLERFSSDSSLIGGIRPEEFRQAFLQYASLLASLPAAESFRAQQRLWDSVAVRRSRQPDSRFWNELLNLSEQAFYHPASELRNEELFIPVLESVIRTEPDSLMRSVWQQKLEICRKNRPGEQAPDFAYTETGIRNGRLYGIRSEYTLVFFTNPECPACSRIIDILTTDPAVSRLTAEGKLTVLNLYIDREYEKWLAYRKTYPKAWINAFDPEGVLRDDGRYAIRAIPSLYLLDRDKKVLFKDATIRQVTDYLGRI